MGALLRLPSLRVGRIAGIPIEINPSWFAVFALVAGVLAFVEFPSQFPGRPVWVDVLSGLVTAALFFLSIVVHEVAHSVVARRTGIAVDRVTLFLFGGVAQLLEEPRTPVREAAMAVAGPAMSVTLSLTAFVLSQALWASRVTDVIWGPVEYLALINLSVAVFNLLPGFPMDGGRLLRALVWWASGDRLAATRAVSFIGQGIGVAAALGGTVAAVAGQGLQWLWLLPMGLFLRTLAAASFFTQRERLELSRTPAGEAARHPVLGVAADAPISDVLRLLSAEGPAVLVEHGEVTGAVSLERALRVAGDAGPDVPVSRAAEDAPFLDAAESLEEVARALSSAGTRVAYVAEGGHLAGAVARSAIHV